MINFTHGLFYSSKFFSEEFCYRIISSITPRGELNRGYNAVCHTVHFTDEMIAEIHSFFEAMRKEYPEFQIPTLICKKYAEVFEYTPGQELPAHFDSPYCKDEYIPFTAVINLNEGYEGGLYFQQGNVEIQGMGSVAFCNTSFTNIHGVKEIKGKKRYALIFDINYKEMLNRYGDPKEWVEV